MLSKAAQKKLLKSLKYSDADIATLVDTDDEKDTSLPTGTVIYTEAEFTTVKANIEKEAKDEGISIGKDLAIKEVKEAFGITAPGKKVDTVKEAIKETILTEAGKTPDAKSKEWETEKQQMQAKLADLNTKLTEQQQALSTQSLNNRFLANLPERNGDIANDDYLLHLNAYVKVEKDGDKEVVTYKGKKLVDDKFNPISFEEGMKQIFAANKAWQPTKQNAEGDGFTDSRNNIPGFFKDMGAFEQHLEKNNIAIGSEKAQNELASAMQKNPNLGKPVAS